MLYVWGTVLLFLAVSFASLDVNHGSREFVARAASPASIAGNSASFSYSSQWGSYGCPMSPNGVAVDSSGSASAFPCRDSARLLNNGVGRLPCSGQSGFP